VRWYVRSNEDYVAHLVGHEYPGKRGLPVSDLNSSGPKMLAIGQRNADGRFNRMQEISPDSRVIAFTQ